MQLKPAQQPAAQFIPLQPKQAPASHTSVNPHMAQTFPPEPQAFWPLPVTHWPVRSQQPLGQLVASQTHLWFAQRCPVEQPPGLPGPQLHWPAALHWSASI
jgi:hypothetical protein